MGRNTRGVGRIARCLFNVSLLVTAAGLAGCNSSGGGGTPASAVAITTQNAAQASGAAYQGVSTAGSSGSSGASVLTAAVTSGGGGSLDLARLARLQLAMFASLGYATGTPVASGATYVQTVPCDPPPVGSTGSVSVTIDDADNSGTLTSGDSLSANFNSCYLASEGMTFNGGFSLSGLTLHGTPSVPGTTWDAGATFSFSNLQISAPAAAYAVNGAFTYSGTSDGVTISSSLTATSLSIQVNSGPTLTLGNFVFTGTTNENTTAYTVYGHGRVSDSALGGYVDFKILSTMKLQGIGSQDPSSGTMTVTGLNNSSVTLIAGSSTVQLEVDSNGDGVYDNIVSEPWSSIAP